MVTIQAIATTITSCPKEGRRTQPDRRNPGMSKRLWNERKAGKGVDDSGPNGANNLRRRLLLPAASSNL